MKVQGQFVALGLAGAFFLLSAQTCSQQEAQFSAAVVATVDVVQQGAVTVCNVLPTVESVAGIIAAAAGQGGGAVVASTIANSICSAVTTAPTPPKASARADGSFAGTALPPVQVCADAAKTKCVNVVGIYTK